MAIGNRAHRYRRHFVRDVWIERYNPGSTGPRGGRTYEDPVHYDALVDWTYHLVEAPGGESKVSTVRVTLEGEPEDFGPNDRITLSNGHQYSVILVTGVSGSRLATLEA